MSKICWLWKDWWFALQGCNGLWGPKKSTHTTINVWRIQDQKFPELQRSLLGFQHRNYSIDLKLRIYLHVIPVPLLEFLTWLLSQTWILYQRISMPFRCPIANNKGVYNLPTVSPEMPKTRRWKSQKGRKCMDIHWSLINNSMCDTREPLSKAQIDHIYFIEFRAPSVFQIQIQ